MARAEVDSNTLEGLQGLIEGRLIEAKNRLNFFVGTLLKLEAASPKTRDDFGFRLIDIFGQFCHHIVEAIANSDLMVDAERDEIGGSLLGTFDKLGKGVPTDFAQINRYHILAVKEALQQAVTVLNNNISGLSVAASFFGITSGKSTAGSQHRVGAGYAQSKAAVNDESLLVDTVDDRKGEAAEPGSTALNTTASC